MLFLTQNSNNTVRPCAWACMNIIAIILTASMLMVSPTANLSSLTFNNSAIVYGHNYLDGGEFYSLDMGDNVAVYFVDGSAKVYAVTDVQAYAAQSTELANTGEDFRSALVMNG